MARYVAELYLPQGTPADLRETAERARRAADELRRAGVRVRHLRALYLTSDQTCFHLFEAESPTSVVEVGRRAAIPVERVVEALDSELSVADTHLPEPVSEHKEESR
jgi:hypothetical protein